MKINADFDQPVVVHSEQMDWIDSPMSGVSRRPLDRVGAEVARATSIVRYSPGSHFSPHVHTGGEEFLVLDGVFQDEHGDFPKGSYIRNPPQSRHTPGSEAGCVIFVKLWQFDPSDRTHVRLNTSFMAPVLHRIFGGVGVTPLYKDEREEVSLFSMEPGAKMLLKLQQGVELLVIEGSVDVRTADKTKDQLLKHSWMRLPGALQIEFSAGDQGAKVWLKQNHLAYVDRQIERVLAAGS